jgi:NAD+ kinase
MFDKTKKLETVGIITKHHNEHYQKLIKKTAAYLKKKKKKIIFDNNSCKYFKNAEGHSKSKLLDQVDLVIILGGDGTILKTARRMTRKKTLILGVNLGNLGFLTECRPEKLFECLDKVFKGQYDVDRRTLLRVTIYRKGKKFETFLALNDAVINQGAFARLITLDLEVDNRKIVKFKADGLIISTPTGSTAHSLSAGGPIIHPKVESLTINPICPNSLSMRPIVIPDNRQLTVTLETQRRDKSAIIGLTLDGQDMLVLQYGDKIKFRRSKRRIYMVRTGNRYYKMLRNKLNWGRK